MALRQAAFFFVGITLLLTAGCAAPAEAEGQSTTQAESLQAAAPTPWAKANNEHCMRKHLEESLALNKERRAGYAQLSGGRSLLASSTMIGMDHMGLAFADEIDRAGSGIDARSGVNIVCELVPSLADAAPMPIVRQASLPEGSYRPLDLPEMRRELRALSDARRWVELEARANRFAEASGDAARYNCFSRQALRTVARLARVVREHGTTEADAFAERAMDLILPMTRSSALVDRMAARAQREGTPILCADMPTVPQF